MTRTDRYRMQLDAAYERAIEARKRGGIAPRDRPNVRRAELLPDPVDEPRTGTLDLRAVFRASPMRIRISRDTARRLLPALARFLESGPEAA